MSDLARNLQEQLECKAALALDPQNPGLLMHRNDLAAEECILRLEWPAKEGKK